MKNNNSRIQKYFRFEYIILIISFATLVIFSIVLDKFSDNLQDYFSKNDDFKSSLGIVVTIVVTFLTAILAFLQLFFTFQTNEIAGVKVEKIFRLVGFQYFFIFFIINVIFYIIYISLTYLFDNVILCLYCAGSIIIICIAVLSIETIYIFMDENLMYKFLHMAMNKKYKYSIKRSLSFWNGDIDEILETLLINRTFTEIYFFLMDKYNFEYNQALMERLLNILLRLFEHAIDFKVIDPSSKVIDNSKHILDLLLDEYFVIRNKEKNTSYYLSFLTCCLKCEQTKEYSLNKIRHEIISLNIFDKDREDRVFDLNARAIIVSSITLLRNGDFELLEIMRTELFNSLTIEKSTYLNRVAFNLSFVFSFLSFIKFSLSDELNDKLITFLDKKVSYYDYKPVSFRVLIAFLITDFYISFDVFLKDFISVYDKCGFKAKILLRNEIVDIKEVAFNWYLTYLLNLKTFNKININNALESKLFDNNRKTALIHLKDACCKKDNFFILINC